MAFNNNPDLGKPFVNPPPLQSPSSGKLVSDDQFYRTLQQAQRRVDWGLHHSKEESFFNVHMSYRGLKDTVEKIGRDEFAEICPEMFRIFKEMETLEMYSKTADLLKAK